MTPSITFRVNLSLLRSEDFGPTTNNNNGDVLHPDQYQTSPDRGRQATANRTNTISTWYPDLLINNRVFKHGDEFTEVGSKATYLKNTYAVGFAPSDRAFLEII